MSSGSHYMMHRAPSATGRAPLAASQITVNDPPGYELDAADHWRFDTDSTSLLGRVNNKVFAIVDGSQVINYSTQDIDAPYTAGVMCTTFTETAAFTVAGVVKKTALDPSNYATIFSTHYGATTTGVQILQLADGSLYVGANGTGLPATTSAYPTNASGIVTAPITRSTDDYYAFAVAFSATGWQAKFVDGALVDRAVSSGARTIRASAGCRIASFSSTNTANDNRLFISELVLWNSTKTEDEIDAIFERMWLRNMSRDFITL